MRDGGTGDGEIDAITIDNVVNTHDHSNKHIWCEAVYPEGFPVAVKRLAGGKVRFRRPTVDEAHRMQIHVCTPDIMVDCRKNVFAETAEAFRSLAREMERIAARLDKTTTPAVTYDV